MAQPASAATLRWDGGGTNDNWSTALNWNPNQAPATGDVLFFDGSVRTTPVNDFASLGIDQLYFGLSAASFTLSGNAITLNTSGIEGHISNTSANLQTINNALNNVASINFLTGSVGAMTLNGAINTSGTLQLGGPSTLTFNGVISGSAGIDSSASLVLLNAANTYTGSTRVETGKTVRLGVNNAIGSASVLELNSGTFDFNGFSTTVAGISNVGGGSGAITLGGGNLTLNASTDRTSSGSISGTGSKLTKTGSAAQTITGSLSYTGGTEVLGGTLSVNALPTGGAVLVQGGTLSSLNSALTTIGALTVNGGTLTAGRLQGTSYDLRSGTVTAQLSGNVDLNKTTTGTLTLSGANTYTGATNISGGGRLQLGGSSTLPAGTAVNISGNSALDLGVFSNTVASVNLIDGTITGSSVTGLGTTGGVTAQNGTISAVLSGTGGLTKTGVGTLTLSGANTYSGATTINAGTLVLGAANVLPSGALAINGATLNMSSFYDVVGAVTLSGGGSIAGSGTLVFSSLSADSGTISVPLGGSGALTKTGTGTLTLSGGAASTHSGPVTVNGGVLALGASNTLGDGSALTVNSGGTFRMNNLQESIASLAGAGNVQLTTSTLAISGGASTTFSGVISGSALLRREGSGTTVLSGANTYSGLTQVTGGALVLGANSALSAATDLDISAGTLAIGNFSTTVGTVTLSGGLISGGTGTLVSNSGFNFIQDGTISAQLGGTGGLSKSGTGSVLLSNTNSYTGATTIFDGTLRMGTTNALPAATSLTLSPTAVLDLNGFSTTGGSLNGSGTLALGPGATFTVGGNNQASAYGGTITGAPDASGNGGLVKVGSGTLTLSGPYQHTGSLVVQSGTLDLPNGLSSPGVLPLQIAGGNVTARGVVNRPLLVGSGGTLTATGNLSVGDITGTGGVSIGGTLNVGSNVVQLVNTAGAKVTGSVQIAEGGRLTVFDQNAGLVLEAGGTINATGNAAVDGNFLNRGAVSGPSAAGKSLVFTDNARGAGSYANNVTFLQDFSPGESPALVTLGNATFASSSHLLMELGGLHAGSEYDKLSVNGLLKLEGGSLSVSLINGFAPHAGDVFDLLDWGSLNGSFTTVTLPGLSEGLFWSAANLYVDGTIAVAVPELESWVMMLAGMGLLGSVARRRRKMHGGGSTTRTATAT